MAASKKNNNITLGDGFGGSYGKSHQNLSCSTTIVASGRSHKIAKKLPSPLLPLR
jgi:hypothetical protein